MPAFLPHRLQFLVGQSEGVVSAQAVSLPASPNQLHDAWAFLFEVTAQHVFDHFSFGAPSALRLGEGELHDFLVNFDC